MVTRQNIDSWVLDYACKNRLHTVIQEVALRHNGDLKQCAMSEVRLACAALPHLIKISDSKAYQTALEIVEIIYSGAPSAVPFTIIMSQLQEVNDGFTLLHGLHRYFPRSLEKKAYLSEEEHREMKGMIEEFRTFLLPLINDDQKLQTFVKNYVIEDKDRALELLHSQVLEFVDSVNKCLPITALEKIMLEGKSHYRSLPCLHNSVDISKFLSILDGKKTLASSDLMNILRLAPT